jgi:hypothetical protein
MAGLTAFERCGNAEKLHRAHRAEHLRHSCPARSRTPNPAASRYCGIGGVVIGAWWQRRAQCNRLDSLTLDTVSLLKAMIARARHDLFLARCLYAGVPLGAGVSFSVLKFAGMGLSPAAKAIIPGLEMIQTGAGVAALIIMIVIGIVLARSRSLQVRDLSEELKSFESDL